MLHSLHTDNPVTEFKSAVVDQPDAGSLRRVLFVTSEISDFVKAGGLGDVSAALPRVLRQHEDVRVLIPGYRSVIEQCGPVSAKGRVTGIASLPDCDIGEIVRPDGLRIFVVLHPALYEREGSPYVSGKGLEWADNGIRFATLSRVAAEIAEGRAGLDWKPDVLHLNDWPSALAAAYVAWNGGTTPSVLTIHNLAYQGLFPLEMRTALGIPAQATEAEFHGQLSFLRAGLIHAACLSTVSRSYAQQITLPAHGCGLHTLLANRASEGRLAGIVNGIDDSWNPRTDPDLAATFSVDDRTGRARNAKAVREEFGLRELNGPLFAFVARLVHQKGMDLICDAMPHIVAAGGQVAVIGHGEPMLERRVSTLARRYQGQFGVSPGFSESTARRMFGGSDFLLMPSRFEPCGLSQMYAQCYGSLPIAHATGGLVDTIDDGVTGLLFHEPTVGALRRCLQRAFRIFAQPELHRAMQRAAMLECHDWRRASHGYRALYDQLAPLKAAA
jgi:starch synthase